MFIHGFAAKSPAPDAPRVKDKSNPKVVKINIIPSAYNDAENIGLLSSFSPSFVKYETVIGIIGNTQGVNNAKNPIPKAKRINENNPLFISVSSSLKGTSESY